MYRNNIQNKKGEQGIALVSTLLIAMALVTALVGITSVVVMNAKRATNDESLVLAAQYAAEAGLTQAQTRVLEFSELLNKSAMSSDLTMNSMEDYAKQYCASYNLATVPPVGEWTDEQIAQGFPLCNVADISQASFDIFEDTIDPDTFEDMNIMSNASASQVTGYWNEILGGEITFNQMVDPNRSVDLSFGFEPVAVRVLADGGRRFVFTQSDTKAVGSVYDENGEVLASRTISLTSPQDEYYIDYGKPSFAYYNLFVENLNSAYFSPSQSYGGAVHVNGDTTSSGPRFYTDCSSDQKATLFRSVFTAVKSSPHWYNTNNCGGAVNDATMYRSDFKYDSEYIVLPENTNNQKRAVVGENHNDTTLFSDEELRQAFRVSNQAWIDDNEAKTQKGAIYYSEGDDGDDTNVSGDWLGGILVKGSVRDLKFELNQYDRQIIEITLDDPGTLTGYQWYRPCYYCSWRQRPVYSNPSSFETTRFEQDRHSDTWIVTRPDGSTHYMNEGFNGLIYVEGNIGRRCDNYGDKTCSRSSESGKSQVNTSNSNDVRKFGLGGDGTDAPDLASNTKITITTTGDIVLRRNITYTDDPLTMGLAAKNVLGLYSNGGSIKMDGPYNKDVKLHATVMASAPEKGYGAIDHTDGRGSGTQEINILGGVIHNVAQASGTSNGGGYSNQWEADPRFAQGYAPPFFPTQTTWNSRVSSGLFNHGATWSYGN